MIKWPGRSSTPNLPHNPRNTHFTPLLVILPFEPAKIVPILASLPMMWKFNCQLNIVTNGQFSCRSSAQSLLLMTVRYTFKKKDGVNWSRHRLSRNSELWHQPDIIVWNSREWSFRYQSYIPVVWEYFILYSCLHNGGLLCCTNVKDISTFIFIFYAVRLYYILIPRLQ